jgi:hypothetical protein
VSERSEDFIGGGDIVESLQAEPEGLGAGVAVTLAAQEAAQAGDPPHGFVQRGRLERERCQVPFSPDDVDNEHHNWLT